MSGRTYHIRISAPPLTFHVKKVSGRTYHIRVGALFVLFLATCPLVWAGEPQSRLDYLAESAAHYHQLDPALIRAVMKVESAGRHFHKNGTVLTSAKGAAGLMQLMPGTAWDMRVDPLDPWGNLYGGAKYLAQMLTRYKGDLRLALAAYNAGPGAVDRASGKVPNYPETQYYVELVLYHYALLQQAQEPRRAAAKPSKTQTRESAALTFWVDAHN